MLNVEHISDDRFREWEEALAPYENGVDEFAREKDLRIDKWHQDFPAWSIGKTQTPKDLDKIWWSIQLGYNEKRKKLSLVATAWIDTEYDVPEGRVNERRGSNSPENHLVATWEKGDPININDLLEKAYQRAASYTEEDLTDVSASITGKDGLTRRYNPHQSLQHNLP